MGDSLVLIESTPLIERFAAAVDIANEDLLFGFHFDFSLVVNHFEVIFEELLDCECFLAYLALEWLLLRVTTAHVCHQIILFAVLAVTSDPIAREIVINVLFLVLDA